MTHQTHAYHIVNPSPWPLTGALSALLLTSGLVIWFHYGSATLLTIGLLTNILTIYQWWRDIIREGTYQGHHTPIVQKGLRYGIILFIISEVFFFAGFFWAFYHSSLVPTHDLGGCWPPTGITPLNPLDVPLLNTSVLLASGVSITWAHHSLIEGKRDNINQALFITILLGLYFTILQASEYFETSFSISDGIYGSTFFIATGFHGLHVIIGSTFLTICLLRQLKFHFTSKHHFGFEAAAWYWHFVDVVWLFLYVSIYWWGSYSLSIINTTDFQSVNFGLTPEESNKFTYYYINKHYTVTNSNLSRILIAPNQPILGKSKSIRMRFWPHKLRTTTIFNKILPGSYYVPIVWPRNCPIITSTMSCPNNKYHNNNIYSFHSSHNLVPRTSLWMNTKRSRMNRIIGN